MVVTNFEMNLGCYIYWNFRFVGDDYGNNLCNRGD